jgi:putative tryptophan/tyrosine transport system substrate-binding protein
MLGIRRREFITLIGCGGSAWPLAAGAQPRPLPIVGFIHGGSADTLAHLVVAFRNGLGEAGYVEGQNVTVEYHWLEGHYDRVPSLVADLIRRRVAVIVALDPLFAQAAKAATTTIPIVFGATQDPVKLGLVASLARPGGNLTGINFLSQEVVTKQLELLHQLLPKALRIAVLVNPAEAEDSQTALRDAEEAGRVMHLQIQGVQASTSREIDAAFATLARERPEGMLVPADSFFGGRRAQLVTLAARDRMPTAYADRFTVAAGGLMSYGTNFADTHRQLGVYTGTVLKGTKPADLPVLQSTKFEFVINLQTARLLDIEVPPTLLAIADEVIE